MNVVGRSANLSRAVHVHKDPRAERIWQLLQNEQDNVQRTVRLLDRICTILLERILDQMGSSTSSRNIVPVYILRGGLIMLHAYQRIRPYSRCGLIVPYRPTPKAATNIVYGDIPLVEPEEDYLLLDLIVNTGATVCACLRSMTRTIRRARGFLAPITMASPFLTELATAKILRQFPDVQIHTIWGRMTIGMDGRLVGLRFDGGDYACGDAFRVHLS